MKKRRTTNDLVDLFDILIRYSLIFIFGLGNLFLFYSFLTPFTIHGMGFILSFFTSSFYYIPSGFFFNGVRFLLVSACVGGSAFYLLFILIMSTREISVLKRVKILVFSFVTLFLFNLFRITLMVLIYRTFYFDLVHWIFWYLLSTVFVFGIWILDVRLFAIRSIPGYSDFLFVLHSIRSSQQKSKKVKKKR